MIAAALADPRQAQRHAVPAARSARSNQRHGIYSLLNALSLVRLLPPRQLPTTDRPEGLAEFEQQVRARMPEGQPAQHAQECRALGPLYPPLRPALRAPNSKLTQAVQRYLFTEFGYGCNVRLNQTRAMRPKIFRLVRSGRGKRAWSRQNWRMAVRTIRSRLQRARRAAPAPVQQHLTRLSQVAGSSGNFAVRRRR